MAQYFWQETRASRVRLGLTEGAQESFGAIKFAELPAVGDQLTVGKPFLAVEAEKTVLDLDAPLSGRVVAVNAAAADDPTVLDSPERSKNWIIELEA
ncbi:glycine cleavage system protein H [Lacticaseibacillus absianus]|uniref:glycine cleavage system protein H n=1 Tax=Lacticaseibacillus absianus TaxID=2729623 RepID=UPI0015C94AE3|nr:glycine cleavage system protein H [Lacticaseibacillus absianus]